MKKRTLSKLFLATLAGCMANLSCDSAQAQPVNVALGKTVTFSAPPNYAHSTDPDDIKQLTDGKYATEGELQTLDNASSLWLQKSAVGWTKINPLVITIDLGIIQPISGISYSTAAGRAGAAWPRAVFIAVSDDNKIWRHAGNLVELSRKNASPPREEEGYADFRFVTHNLQTKGRYVALGIVSLPFTFTDEIEVYQGDESWLNRPTSGRLITTDLTNWVKESMTPAMVLRRIQQDAAAISAQVKNSSFPETRKSTFIARLNKAVTAAEKIETLPSDFKAILPLSEEHRDILAVRGELLANEGFAPLTVWKQHRYAWLPLLAQPAVHNAPQLSIEMLKNQFRSDALLLTNTTGKVQTARLQLKSPPQGAQDGWLEVSSVAWTDTAEGIPVADALLPVEAENNVYQINIPAGMTRKIWLTVDSSKVPDGIYKSTFNVVAGTQQTTVPFDLNISSLAMERPRMSLGVWDYTNLPTYRAITPQNRDAVIKLMRSHYVDTPWATGKDYSWAPGKKALPLPAATEFDAQHNLKNKLDFTNFNEWAELWPDARRYFVALSAGDTFAGAKMGTPEFHGRVGSWAKALSAHMKAIGKQPHQLGLQIRDEPKNDTEVAIISEWAKAINAAAPELTLFTNPILRRPDEAKNQQAITAHDLVCFHIPVFKTGGLEVRQYAENLRKQGKELWLYQCTGPVRLYDPQLSYRHMAWHVYSIGGTGQNYWAFGDTGEVPSSWNEYATKIVSYAPAFIDKDTVHNSIHWDSVREGIEDYEELAMLQDAIDASRDTAWKKQAQQVLDGAVEAITSLWEGIYFKPNYDWWRKTDPNLTDEQLQKVRKLLIENKS